jgi:hypothetical protein
MTSRARAAFSFKSVSVAALAEVAIASLGLACAHPVPYVVEMNTGAGATRPEVGQLEREC